MEEEERLPAVIGSFASLKPAVLIDIVQSVDD
jgi:hypothetical protein